MKTDLPSPARVPAHSPDSPSREEEALAHLGQRVPDGIARRILICGFCVVLGAGLAAEAVLQKAVSRPRWETWQALWPSKARWASVRTPSDLWALLPQPQATRAAEKALEEGSALMQRVRPRVQLALTAMLREGNSQVRVARGGRGLFFTKDCESVEGPGFEVPAWMARRVSAGMHADAAAAILDFHTQLASRGIALLVLPVPVKPMVEGHWMTGGTPRMLANRSHGEFLKKLREAGVHVLDFAGELVERERQTGVPQYLQMDTHWRPEAMEAVAKHVAGLVRTLVPPETGAPDGAALQGPPRSVSAPGDTFTLLGLPEDQRLFAFESVEIHPVTREGRLWKPDPHADVLLLGDSFTNIYSVSAMGWGEGAGFSEQVSAALGRPVDVLARNSDGAYATRAMLQRELTAGRDRLRGKRVVVWEFASRELSFGDWRLIPLEVGPTRPAVFYAPDPGRRARVRGVVGEISAMPDPGSVPYREHIVCLKLLDVVVADGGAVPGQQALVYGWSMRERQSTDMARLRPGDAVELELQLWDDVAGEFEKFQRSELADPLLAAEPACWVNVLKQAPSAR